MPRRPLRPCTVCGAASQGGRCGRHARAPRHRAPDPRLSARARGYDREHEAWRERILARDRWCRHCGRKRSLHADHIIPIRQGGARFALSNGQGLCRSCHNRKTARERGDKRGAE